MSAGPRPAPQIAALAASRPFIAPEELARRAGYAALLRLGANESAFGPPPAALAALQAGLDEVAWYGDPEASELRAALAARHGCSPHNIVVAAGIDDLLGLAVRAYLAPGEATVATLGTYPTYAYHVSGYGARLETVPYREDGSVQLERLAAHAHATRARVAYLANPDNPSGAFVAAGELQRFVAALPAECLVVLDEAYADFVAKGELPADEIDPRVVRLRTFSKAYGLAGLRIGYCLAAPAVIDTFAKIRLQYGVNRLAQRAALAALGDDAFVAGVASEVARGRAEYRALAERHGLRTLASRANFVCIDVGSQARAEALVEELLHRAVFVRKPVAPPLAGCIRVTVGTAPERVRFAEAFSGALATLQAASAP